MTAFAMPAERDFGWLLKTTDSTCFDIHKRANGQFCVVLNHSLLRGVTSEMIFWWFQNFANLKVTLRDVPGYESQSVAAYLLWHPADHCSARLLGETGPGGTARAGNRIHIREAMQYEKYALKYPVDTALDIFYCEPDGWAMGKSLPVLGKVMCLRIHYRDVVEQDRVIGAHYHYEIVVGASGNNPVARAFNRRMTREYSPEFFAAWHLHNTIEVGTFENFLPALFAQRADAANLQYETSMNPIEAVGTSQQPFDPALYAERIRGYTRARDPFAFQDPEGASFL